MRAVTFENVDEGPARGDRTERKDAKRHQHRQRAFVRRFIVMLIVRRAVEGLENKPPGIERRQRRGADGHDEAVACDRAGDDVIGFDDRVLGEKPGS